ncbi:MAG: thiamine-phosphate diphosphorylase [Comamonas sp. SCN 67-35]|uniref:thiamine phosphate synthase n=1 Tax=unclassified Comamonas TaxID=2638500 RepID=UPI00086A1049|nr:MULTISPECIES: thiamine phosphate synthase [unclassified Comamonas]MBN9329085.1 thiamine phosphate synthase [Comamonas sp.]ODU38768.1 MAG: thiamine-phosphate diphosphorylase [Comamonas sp. SCN 67-35]OJX01809.1 MAG: thiamine-phosphate diphosphorylase [Burkholderiales bacterium 66-26]
MARAPLDLRLYLITDTRLCGAHGVARTVAEAVAAGATLVQLREPQASDAAFVALGRELMQVLAGSGVPLIVNDRVHLVAEIGAAGAHVGQGDISPVQARRILGDRHWLGLSVQTPAHLQAALALPEGTLDYLGVGPVWAQRTKPDAAPAGGPEVLADIARASPWPCVAIGGIDASRVGEVRRRGAAGVAVVSAICGQPDVTAATRRLRIAWDGAASA